MIIATHLIFGAYGFWLPNDPRGSWSDFVRSWELLRHGRPVRPTAIRSVASVEHDHQARADAKEALRYPAVVFTGQQALCIASGFKLAIEEGHYQCFACAIMPDHMHLVIGRHDRDPDQIIGHLKSKATMELTQTGMHPLSKGVNSRGETPSPWARKGWKVFIDADDDFQNAVQYVRDNPLKAGLKAQNWSFVVST